MAGTWSALAFFSGHATAKQLTVRAAACTLITAFLFLAVALLGARLASRQHSQAAIRLSRCALSSVVLFIFLPEYLSRIQPPGIRSLLLLIITTGLYLTTVCLTLYTLSSKQPQQLQALHIRFAIAAFVLLTGLASLTTLAIHKYTVFGYVGQDLAYFAQLMHTTLEGHLFWGNLLQDLIYTRPVQTDFAGHNSPVMFLFLPFYAIAPSPLTLLVLRNLTMFACAWPAYQLARLSVNASAAVLWSAAFLLTPTILYQCIFDFYPLSFVALPLLFAMLFYTEQRFVPFMAAVGAMLVVREDLVFAVFGLGLLACFQRRSWRWSLPLLGLAAAWACFSFLLVLPLGLHGAHFVTESCFSHLGSSPSQMLASILHHPRQNILVHGNLVYLKTLFTATGLVLGLGSPAALLALPYLAINLLAGAGRCITTVIFAQYSVVPATLLFCAALFSITRSKQAGRPWIRRASHALRHVAHLGLPNQSVPPLLLIALCLASMVFVTEKTQLNEFQSQPWTIEAQQVASLIPANASVAAPRYMLPHLANRDCIYQTHRLLQYYDPVYEYLIVDPDWSHINAAQDYRQQYERVEQMAASNVRLQLLYSSPRFRVYHDASQAGHSCFPSGTSQ